MGEGALIPAGSGGTTALLQIESAFVQGRDTPTLTTNELISMVPYSWFSTQAKRRGGVFWTLMSGIGLTLANIKDVMALLKKEFRLLTASGGTLDIISLDFFGTDKKLRLPRHRNEVDDSFRARIKSTLLRPHGTITGIKQSVKEVTGVAPIVLENLNFNDYDSWTGVVSWDDTKKQFYVVPYVPFDATKSFLPIPLYNTPVLGSTSIIAFQELNGARGGPIFDVPAVGGPPVDASYGPFVWWFRGDELVTDFGIGGGINIWRNAAPDINHAAPFQFRWFGTGTQPTVQRNINFAPCASFATLGNLLATTASGPGGTSGAEWTLYMVISSTSWPAPIFTPGNGVQSFLSASVIGGRAGTTLLANWYDGTNAAPNTEGMLFDYYPASAAQEFKDVQVKMPAGFPFLVIIRSKLNGTTVAGVPQADVAVNVNGTGFLNFQRDAVHIANPILGATASPNVANFQLWEMLRFDAAHTDEQMQSVWEYLIEAHLIPDGVPIPASVPNLGTQSWGAKELGAPYEFWVFSFQNPLEAPDDAILDAIDRAKPIATLQHVFIIK